MQSICYDQIAKRDGAEVAQAIWLKNGGRGTYVPGMIAEPGFMISESGTVTHSKTEPT